MNTKTNLYYTTFIQINNKNLLGVKFFHLSSTLCADNAKNTAQMVNNQINQVNVNNLQVATYAPNPSREELLNRGWFKRFRFIIPMVNWWECSLNRL